MVGSESDDIVPYIRHCRFRRKSGLLTNNRTGDGRRVVDQGVKCRQNALNYAIATLPKSNLMLYELGSKIRPLVLQSVWPEYLRNEVGSWTAPSVSDVY